MMRDAAGRAKVAAPSAADDIARKDTVDVLKTQIENGTVVVGNASQLNGKSFVVVAQGSISIPKSGTKLVDLNRKGERFYLVHVNCYGDTETLSSYHATWKIIKADHFLQNNDSLELTNPSSSKDIYIPYKVLSLE
jgi:hypothetical protein